MIRHRDRSARTAIALLITADLLAWVAIYIVARAVAGALLGGAP